MKSNEMKYFMVYYTKSDMCGNTWASDAPNKYYAAKSISDVIKQENIRVVTYQLRVGKYPVINKSRTPKGKGFGQWEDNPNFLLEENLEIDNIMYVEGAPGTHIKEIYFRFL